MPRVLTARFMHETNTFSRVKTDMALIRRRDFHLENEIPQAFRGTRSALGATFEAADKYGWSLVHPVSANPNPSGIVADDAFETIAGMILDAVDAKGPIDGVLLHLHGAMVSDSHEDAEGELLARLRAKARAADPGRRHPRPARQRHAEDGRQCQCADRLSHLSACRHVRARLAGRRPARTRDAGRDPAA